MKVYTYFRWLSLDIVLGAIFFLMYLAKLYDLAVPVSVYVELSVAVWLIYLIDHLIDSTKNATFCSERHKFYQARATFIQWLIVMLSMVGFLTILWLPASILKNGLILSAFSIGYLLLVYFKPNFWIKELLVSIGYAFGVFLAPLSLKANFSGFDFLLIFSVAIVALINLMIFSIYEMETDEEDDFPSLVRKLGRRKSKILTYSLLLLSALFSFLIGFYHLPTAFMILMMTIILWLLLILESRLVVNQWYRVIGDGIFYLPVLFIPFG